MLKRRKFNKLGKLLGMAVVCAVLSGCSEGGFVISQEDSEMTEVSEMVQEEEKQTEPEKDTKGQTENDADTAQEAQKEEMAVHICGAVEQPGVYIFQKEARIYEGIQKAGGFREDALKDYLNLALPLEDGMKIEVPTGEELQRWQEEGVEERKGISYGNDGNLSSESSSDGRVNLNTADEALLCTLPGIGESKAKSILAYREENGYFQNTEDIMMIPGIKEAAYEKIKDLVKVSD